MSSRRVENESIGAAILDWSVDYVDVVSTGIRDEFPISLSELEGSKMSRQSTIAAAASFSRSPKSWQLYSALFCNASETDPSTGQPSDRCSVNCATL
jgi:hypothetical protein